MRFPRTGRKLLRFGALLVAVTVAVSVIAGSVLNHYLSDGERLARWLGFLQLSGAGESLIYRCGEE